MIRYLRGQVIEKAIEEQYFILDVKGVGYRVFVSKREILSGNTQGEIALHTHYAVKEDSIRLYGFLDKKDLQMFEMLIGVSKIGPKNALNILDAFSYEQILMAIQTEDYNKLTQANGIGAKTAQRIVLELKDKVKKIPLGPISAVASPQDGAKEAVLGLVALGFSEGEALEAVGEVSQEGLCGEDLIKEALKNLYKR